MRYIFFVNPKAGQGKGVNKLIDNIREITDRYGFKTDVFVTTGSLDAERKAKLAIEKLNGEEARFYACGGDGTANEVLNGIYGHDNISLGIIPIGTGNDTVRNFKKGGDFLDIEKQIMGKDEKIDVVKCTGNLNGKYDSRYFVNMCNIGFDCNVAEFAGRLKKKPLIAGSAAYIIAVFGMFIEKKGISLSITENDKLLKQGKMLLCAISNGSYCGGGICSSPKAVMNDGKFDLNIVYDLPRTKFLKMFPSYTKGTHFDSPEAEYLAFEKKCTKLSIKPYNIEEFFICTDGEIFTTDGIDMEICPKAVNFIVPAK